nr:hypothetical protein [Tanacetum cinerariifolium]
MLLHPSRFCLPGVYRPEWGVTNGSLFDTPAACQDLVDHVAPPGYFAELRQMPNDEFLWQYNVNLARQVAMGSQLRLRFEQEAKLLKKSVAQVARREKRIQDRELEIKNLEVRLETEAEMKRAAEGKNAELVRELEDICAQFSGLQVSNERLSEQVAALQEQVSGEEKLKAAFEEFKRYEDDRVEKRCAELDARLDALSIDFDEELYPHMLTAIAGRRWVIGHGLRLAMMKCAESVEMRQAFADVVLAGIAKGMSEGLKHGVELGRSQLGLESIEAYDPEAEAKFVVALQSLKDLKVILEGMPHNTYAISAPVPHSYLSPCIRSRAEKKRKCRIICRTHGVGSAHHARSDGIPVSVPAVVPQGLGVLLVDGSTQTDPDECIFAFCAPWESFVLPNVLGLVLWTRSPWLLGLQPAYAADRVPRETAAPEMPPHEEVPVATAPGSGQAVEAVVAGPPTARCKEEIALADAIAANISRAEKKKKCRIVCRTHGVGYAHHARSDGIPVSVHAVVPQGLAVLLVDGATQTDPEECIFAFYAPWESLLLPNVLGLVLWTRSPRPLGLQPAYAADHAP